MNELVEAGKAIIMVSSDMPELLGMSDRIVVIAEGHKNGEVEKQISTKTIFWILHPAAK